MPFLLANGEVTGHEADSVCKFSLGALCVEVFSTRAQIAVLRQPGIKVSSVGRGVPGRGSFLLIPLKRLHRRVFPRHTFISGPKNGLLFKKLDLGYTLSQGALLCMVLPLLSS